MNEWSVVSACPGIVDTVVISAKLVISSNTNPDRRIEHMSDHRTKQARTAARQLKYLAQARQALRLTAAMKRAASK